MKLILGYLIAFSPIIWWTYEFTKTNYYDPRLETVDGGYMFFICIILTLWALIVGWLI